MRIAYETKGGAIPGDKARVYFTSHPADFERYFQRVCDDLFEASDCAVFYTDDPEVDLEDQDYQLALERMQLFVIPVTFQLLSEPNRAIDVDLEFARKKHIPVLPLMMETDLDDLYSLPEKFGEMQYVCPISQDVTEVNYKEKLKKYLSSVLISAEMAERVRAAFDAYIFLSYRKKDRRYANELMRIIHGTPGCRDIAIWFDEFLTPGESFAESIDQALRKSEFFTLLVTPRVLEKVEGKPNFVMGEEYPAARKYGKDVVAAMMEPTDENALRASFQNLPECIDVRDDEAFHARLLAAVQNVATMENDGNPDHNFLIGLAYLDGIDVERNPDRALELIANAAEAGQVEAMAKLSRMYSEGSGVELNWQEAAKWAERLLERRNELLGVADPATLSAANDLVLVYQKLNRFREALSLSEEVYKLESTMLGDDHPETLNTLNNIATAYYGLGDYQKSFEVSERALNALRRSLGQDHPRVLSALNNLAGVCCGLGDYARATTYYDQAYQGLCRMLGDDHPKTLMTLGNLGLTYYCRSDYQSAFDLAHRAYEEQCRVLGPEHPDTLTSLNSFSLVYDKIGRYDEALYLHELAYEGRCRVLGPNHPSTITSLGNMGISYAGLGNYEKSREIAERVYEAQKNLLGEEHPKTLISVRNLAATYANLGQHQKALSAFTQAYEAQCRVLGPEHPNTYDSLIHIALLSETIGDDRAALEAFEKAFAVWKRLTGRKDPRRKQYAQKIRTLRKAVRQSRRSQWRKK